MVGGATGLGGSRQSPSLLGTERPRRGVREQNLAYYDEYILCIMLLIFFKKIPKKQ